MNAICRIRDDGWRVATRGIAPRHVTMLAVSLIASEP
jgi:hypothetical protein